MNILTNRKTDNRLARFRELLASPATLTHGQMAAIIDRAFEAGVAAESDRAFAERLEAMESERSRSIEIAEGVRFMDEEPGNLIKFAIG